MQKHLHPKPDSGKQFYLDFHDKGKVVMLNLLKYRSTADYSDLEAIRPEGELTGEETYRLYMEHTWPELEKAGSRVLYFGTANHFLIGPDHEQWDAILLVEHASVAKFMEFAQNEDYLRTAGHRTAALEDSRLLPSTEVRLSPPA